MPQQIVRSLLRPINPTFNILLGVFSTVWGLWLVAPWWTVFETAKAFEAAFLDEAAWGVVAISIGAIVTWGAIRPAYIPLALGTGLAGAFWAWVSLVLLIGDWQNTGWITYGFVSIYATLLYVNVKVNHDNGHLWSGQETDDVG